MFKQTKKKEDPRTRSRKLRFFVFILLNMPFEPQQTYGRLFNMIRKMKSDFPFN